MPFKKRGNRSPKKKTIKTKSLYHPSVARSLQIATRRNFNQKLKFVTNQTYIYNSAVTPDGDSCVLKYSANSIYNSQVAVSTLAGPELKSQNPALYSNLVSDGLNQDASGYDQWSSSYQHFTVAGSKIQITCRPMGTGVPTQVSIVLAGKSTAITSDTKTDTLATMPFMRRAIICSTGNGATNSVRLYHTYSARKFEGVRDPTDNSNLRGRFADNTVTPPVAGTAPTESSYFYVVVSPVDPNVTGKVIPMMITTKVEYVTILREPTLTNKIQERALPQMGGGADYSFFTNHANL